MGLGSLSNLGEGWEDEEWDSGPYLLFQLLQSYTREFIPQGPERNTGWGPQPAGQLCLCESPSPWPIWVLSISDVIVVQDGSFLGQYDAPSPNPSPFRTQTETPRL